MQDLAKELLMCLKQNDMVTPINHKECLVCLLYKKKETYTIVFSFRVV